MIVHGFWPLEQREEQDKTWQWVKIVLGRENVYQKDNYAVVCGRIVS